MAAIFFVTAAALLFQVAQTRLFSAAAINGAASVIGSILAVALTINVGFTIVGIVAVACYLVPVIAGRAQRLGSPENTTSERAQVAS